MPGTIFFNKLSNEIQKLIFDAKNKNTANVRAGNRTRADALEERHTNHYTTRTYSHFTHY